MSRTSLHRPHRPRAVWDRPAPGTCLLPTSSSFTVSPSNPLPGDGRSINYSRHVPAKGPCRFDAPSSGRLRLAVLPFDEDSCASTNAQYGAFVPICDPTGSISPSPSAVERCRGTDLPHSETPSSSASLPGHGWGIRRAAANLDRPLLRTTLVGVGVIVSLRMSPGPSIACSLPSPTVIPSSLHRHARLFIPSFLPGQESIPLRHSRPRSGIHPAGPLTLSAVEGKGQTGHVPSLVPRQRLRTTVIPRTREESGAGHSVLECASGSTVRPSFLATRKDFLLKKAFRRQTIKLAANSINYQSTFNQVQSTTNQTLSIHNQEQSLFNHNLDPHPYIHPLPPSPSVPDNDPQAAALMPILGGETL